MRYAAAPSSRTSPSQTAGRAWSSSAGTTSSQLNRAESNAALGFSIRGAGRGSQGNTITRNVARRNTAGGFDPRFSPPRGRRRDPDHDAEPCRVQRRRRLHVRGRRPVRVAQRVRPESGRGGRLRGPALVSVFTGNRLTNNPGFGIRNQAGGVESEGNVCRGNGLGASSSPASASRRRHGYTPCTPSVRAEIRSTGGQQS